MHKIIFTIVVCLITNALAAHGTKSSNGSFTFIENIGQWDKAVKYKAEIDGATIYFENNAFHFQFQEYPTHPRQMTKEEIKKEKKGYKGHNFNAEFIGSNKNINIKQKGESGFYYNYFLGNDKSKWKSGVKKFKSITYENLYDGIDLTAYQHNGFLKYDYKVAPGIDPSQIKVRYSGVEQPIINEGQLIILHSLGKVVEEKPFAYQYINGKKVKVGCNFYFDEEGNLGFQFPEGFDKEVSLIIDPELIFSTYSGSSADNFGMSATYDNEGNGYMGGIAYGNGYNTTLGAFQTTFGGGSTTGSIDISISKFFTEGDSLIYSTYLGGNRNETIHSMVVSESQELFILGATASANFPVTSNAFDTLKTTSTTITTDVGHRFVNGADIIVSKFDASGKNLLGSTYFGGAGVDGINYNPGSGSNTDLVFNYGDSHRGEIVLDSSGNCYIGTSTTSSSLSSINSISGGLDGLIAKFSPNLTTLIWSRYLGGTMQDAIYSLKVIDSNRVLVGGGTISNNFPITLGSYQDQAPGGRADGFISIISADGTAIDRSTFIGTSNYDQVYFIEFDRFNSAYAFGQSRGGLFPIKNSTIADSSAGQFIIKLDRNLDSAIYSLTFGDGGTSGRINISPTAFLVDRCQNAFASGWGGSLSTAPDGGKTLTSNMPISADAYSSSTDNKDFYLYGVNRFGDSLLYASYFGDPNADDHVDGGTSRFDKQGIIYQSVCACNNSFPTKNAYSTNNQSFNCNNALFKLDFQVLPTADFTTSEDTFCLSEANRDTIEVLITNTSTRADKITWDFYGTQVTSDFQDTTIYITQAGSYTIQVVVEDTVCLTDDNKITTLLARPDNIQIITSLDTTICYNDSVQLTAFTNGFANDFTWSKNRDFSNPLASNDSIVIAPLDSGINLIYVQAGNPNILACEKIDSIEVNYIPVIANASISEDTICENSSVDLTSSLQNVDRFVWDLDNGRIDSVNASLFETFNNAGTYNIQFEVENFLCPSSDTIELPLEVTPNSLRFENLSDTLLCGSDGFVVTKNSFGTATTYIWSSNNNFSDTLNISLSDSTFFIDKADSAAFYIKISDSYCENTDSLNAEYIEYELLLDPIIDSTCSPFSTELQTTIIGTDSFRLFFGNGNSTATDSTPIVNYQNAGIYPIQLIGSNSKCNIQDTITEPIEVFQGVSVQAPNDTVICLGDSVSLIGNSFGTASNYFWATSRDFNQPLNPTTDSTLSLLPTQENITYYFKGENVICNAIDSLNVGTELLDIDLEDIVSICLEDTVEIEANIINSRSNLSFLWSPNDSIISGQNTSEIIAAPLEDMTFYLRTTSALGCVDVDSSEVDVNIPAFTSAEIRSVLDSLFEGQTTQLSTNRNGSNLVYLWEPDSGLNNVNSPSPTLKAIESKNYKVTITDLNTGCIVVAFKRIKVFEVNCGEPDIFIPSAFTPNQDLSNDVLYVRGANVKSVDFQLYNRWGERVFETQDINVGWDGRYKGREVDPGVFVYSLKAVCFDDQEYFTKGDVTLIR